MMQQFTAPGEVAVDENETLTTPIWQHERSMPDHPLLAHRPEGGSFVDVTAAEMAQQVRRIAAGIIGLGIEPGSRICIFSPTRIEYALVSYAIWAAGCAVVTLYDTSSAEQVEWIVSDSGAVAIVCATDELEKTFRERAGRIESCRHVFTIDEGGLDELIAAGADVSDDDVRARDTAVRQDDLACLIYTSGTTGQPKGCVLSHRNYVWTCRQVLSVLDSIVNPQGVMLMFLPLAHVLANLVQVLAITAGNKTAFSTGIPNLTEELPMVRPTWMFAVPRVFEKIYNGAQQKAHAEGKGRIFDHAAKISSEYSRQSMGGGVSLPVRLQHAVFDRLVYKKLRAVFGGRCDYVVSGGAALGERLGHFFNGLGTTVLEGYGLTETTAPTTVNRPDHLKIGTVGLPLPGATVAIADDGEILVRGPHVFGGYWQDPAATSDAIDADGFLHTGDIGELDEDGYLRVTDRKKEIIVTAGGKNVAPAVLEDRIRAHALVSQAMVVGDNRPFVSALITLDPDEFSKWAEQHNKARSLTDLVDDPDLVAAVQSAVDDANRAVSQAESIRAFRIMAEDFTIEGGELTPTLKLKRRVVRERYADDIERLYRR